jgi:hypothetical protein
VFLLALLAVAAPAGAQLVGGAASERLDLTSPDAALRNFLSAYGQRDLGHGFLDSVA